MYIIQYAMTYEDYNDNEVSSVGQRQHKNQLDDFHKNDKYYEVYMIPFNRLHTDGKFYKFMKSKSFGSGQVGSRIRNAVTGERYTYLVGSKDEHMFFKVNDSTGRNGRKNPLTMFYESPDHYERHAFVTVEQSVKDRWNNKV